MPAAVAALSASVLIWYTLSHVDGVAIRSQFDTVPPRPTRPKDASWYQRLLRLKTSSAAEAGVTASGDVHCTSSTRILSIVGDPATPGSGAVAFAAGAAVAAASPL